MNPNLSTAERNQLIFKRHKNGEDIKTLANEYRISVGMVKLIVQRHILQKAQDKESQELLKTIREANDLDRKWNRTKLLNTINYPQKVRNGVNLNFYPNVEEVSLRQLMDWSLPVVPDHSDRLYDYLPSLVIAGFGKYAVTDLINYTEDADLGAAFMAEWLKRRDTLRRKFAKPEKRRPLFK